MPAVMKTMSAPSSTSMIFSVSSSAAWRPTSGVAPAPSPFVILLPIWSLTAARELRSACTSVLATMNSTPVSPESIMRLTALPPEPPTPMTLMLAPYVTPSSRANWRPFLLLLSSMMIT